eukprot:COSAG06_NODE_9125_length_1980_cov_2.270069_2_plen_84_part_01
MAALKVLGGVLAAAAAASEAVPHDSATKPNIVWVMSDDMGWGEPGAYPSTGHGGLRISTPHVARPTIWVPDGTSERYKARVLWC